MNPKYLIIIPAFNEANNILPLLEKIKTCGPHFLPLVIDDGSSDLTFETAHSKALTLRHPINLGIGATIQTGLNYAKENGFEFCIQVDGDGQHDPSQIIKLIEKYEKDNSNLIIGSRFIENKGFQSTFSRRLGISLIKTILNVIYKIHITDPTSGFRLFDSKAITIFSQFYPYDYPEPISIAYGINRGLTVSEIPVTMLDRFSGQSTIQGFSNIKYMIKTVLTILLMKILRP